MDKWMQAILSSGSSSVILNAELLQYVINQAHQLGILALPIPQHGGSFPIVQYADDTLLVMQADARQLFYLKALLNSFSASIGLKVNFGKSSLVPINVSQDKMLVLSNTFGCQIGSLPFTYLGLPLGTTKPRIADFSPLNDKIERRLSACSVYLSYSGRLEMVNSVITPTVTYAMSTFKLHVGLIENIDIARRAVGSFWWRDVLKLYPQYKELTECKVGDGSSILFWDDVWLQAPIKELCPVLHQFALDPASSIMKI
ncbi:hypothetical protein U9M48_036446 [Paspalum notatum var. saurae]|uniref:Reverse transcriptase domain-containing protein n=1 Tax=Paspalum notatum var. saurae TaxID=547442 RepID=A0AAQ3XA35_PASNO